MWNWCLKMVNLIWSTPDGDNLIAKLARVSNPQNENNIETAPRLIKYLIKHKHWSPFEMASACVEIITTRDIAHQIIRHRSFSFQEFSQRYAEIDDDYSSFCECRLQDTTNRQNSIPTDDPVISAKWSAAQWIVWKKAITEYKKCLKLGIAKELARKLLPEGLTLTRLYMSGTIRSWIHYLDLRTHPDTQKEHREIATQIKDVLKEKYPVTFAALSDE